MKIRFKATDKMKRYNGTYSFVDGDVKDIPEDEAKRLLDGWPDNFEELTKAKASEPDETKAMRPKRNKLFKPDRDK